MAPDVEWDLERFRPLLRIHSRRIQLDPRLKRRFDESDLIQDVMARAIERRRQFRGTTDAETAKWLMTIMTRMAADQMRKARAGKQDVALERYLDGAAGDSSVRMEAILADTATSPSAAAERREDMIALARAIDDLPDGQRDAYIARHLLGQSVAEIAATMDRTEKSVAGLLCRAQVNVAERFKALGGLP
jgi:RNA polymerase sigma-70 factor (ECF subfamily)